MIATSERIRVSTFSEQANFWTELENQPTPAEGLITENINPAEVVGFIRGCEEMLDHVQELDPSVIFTAARGGCVPAWTIEELSKQRGYQLPPIHTFLVGNRRDIFGFNTYSPTKWERGKTIMTNPTITDETLGGNVKNPLVIDEKTGGRTSRYVASKVNALLQDRVSCYSGPVHLIALEYKDPKKDFYAGLHDPSHRNIIPSVVKAPNPFVDKKVFLDTIIDPPYLPTTHDSLKPQMLKHLHNVEAEKLLKFLALAVNKPEALGAVLGALNGIPVAFSDTVDYGSFSRLYGYVRSAIEQQRGKNNGTSFDESFVQWLNKLKDEAPVS